MASTAIDPRILRSSPFRKTIQHLRDVQQSCIEDEITAEILHLIEIESIAPTVCGQWLGVARSPEAVRAALTQNTSIEVRRLAIKKLGKLLSSASWLDTWNALGEVQGLLKLFSDFSVQELKQVCRIFVRSVKNSAVKAHNEAKQAKLTELVKALLPDVFPEESNSLVETNDDRQLRAIYQRLLPKCTDDVVTQVVAGRKKDFEQNKRNFLLSHSDLLQDLALQYVFENNGSGKRWLAPLLSEYPPASTDIKSVSASMQYTLQMLQRLTTDNAKAPLPVNFAITNLAEPLLKRSMNKNVNTSFIQNIIDLAMLYLDKHPDAVPTLTFHSGQFVQLVGVCWSREPEVYTERFTKLLSLPFHKVPRKQFFPTMTASALHKVAKSRRYRLILFYYQGLYMSDLSKEDGKSGGLSPLTHTLLDNMLPPEDALDLFTRVRLIKGDGKVMNQSIYSQEDGTVDVNMVHTLLLFRCGRCVEAEEIARKGFAARKKAAFSSVKPDQRAIHARHAIEYATASGSLQFCMEAHEWARRFLRDPLTLRELYQSNPNEARILLSGVWGRLNEHTSFAELRDRVECANKILQYMFETACLALREPSFQRHHLSGIFSIFDGVVRERMSQAKRLKKHTVISDEELYQTLWKDLPELLVTIEEKGLASGFERLDLDTTRGILGGRSVQVLTNEETSTYRFLDELAKARDALWRKHRLSVYPAVAALPNAFPRGLAVQDLLGSFELSVHDLHKNTPYIAARVEAAVFPDPVAALEPVREDKEAREAIGVFVDSYTFALRMMIPGLLDKKEKQERVNRAWSYATGTLSRNRFTHEEALRYWQRDRWSDSYPPMWPGEEVNKPRFPDWPVVPDAEHDGEVEEWNPVPAGFSNILSRELYRPTYIDMSKTITKDEHNATIKTKPFFDNPVIPGVREPDLFSVNRCTEAKAKPAMKEGQIFAALLYVDNLLPQSQVFRQTFPLSERQALVRYPKRYLDGDCLHTENQWIYEAFSCLETHLGSVPPSVLCELATNAFSALKTCPDTEKRYRDLEDNTLRLARLLTRCDRPALASEFVVRLVLERADNSSWHRQLLSRSFFRRLPGSVAQDCMNKFAAAIIAEVERQNATKAARSSAPSVENLTNVQPSQQPYVKVTTIKLLAQLLGDTQFISKTFAFSVLSRLIEKASHVDVRRAVVDNLLSLFEDAPEEKADTILTALETVIPVAGNLRERQPITDAEWTQAEDTLELPEIDSVSSSANTAPMLWSLLSFIKTSSPGSSRHARQSALVTRIIVPVVTSLKHQTAKWTSLFLRTHGFDFAAQQDLAVPPLPRDYDVLHEVLRRAVPYLPATFLTDLTAHRTFNIAPPPALANLNASLTSSPTPSSKYWLANYALGLRASTLPFTPISLLTPDMQNPAHPLLTGAITPKRLQEAYLTLYTVTLHHDDPPLRHIVAQHRLLWPFSASSPIPKAWDTYLQPLVSAATTFVESLRTREWERDPDRRPAVLPDTFPLRMLLLRFAAQHSEGHASGSEEHCAAFAARVAKVLDQIVGGGVYHHRLAELKGCLEYLRGRDRLRVAVHLGDISRTRLSWLTVLDRLRVEVAAGLVRGKEGWKVEDELAERVKALVRSWRASESEEVRRVGVELLGT